MPVEPGLFEAFYASAWQHPWLLWWAAALACRYAFRRHDRGSDVRRYAASLTVLSATDAWLTASPPYAIGPLPEAVSALVPLFFVLAGDFRFLLLLTSATDSGGIRPHTRSIASAAAFTLIVPVASQLLVSAVPGWGDKPRVLYLTYELLFLALALALRRVHPIAKKLRWVRSVCGFVALYYGLWALADLLILGTGSDLGFALRVVPNVLYYGGLIAAIAHFAPRLRAPSAV
ncbi:MAG: hypothetical protein HKP27_08335 [Myxococcales bacterium]|nr:hypothetical protein [Myxococcales bacterium]